MGHKAKRRKTGKKKRKEYDGYPLIDNTGGRFFIDELVLRDKDWDRIFKIHDRELGNALKGIEKFINEKYQEPTTMGYDRYPASSQIKFNFGTRSKKR